MFKKAFISLFTLVMILFITSQVLAQDQQLRYSLSSEGSLILVVHDPAQPDIVEVPKNADGSYVLPVDALNGKSFTLYTARKTDSGAIEVMELITDPSDPSKPKTFTVTDVSGEFITGISGFIVAEPVAVTAPKKQQDAVGRANLEIISKDVDALPALSVALTTLEREEVSQQEIGSLIALMSMIAEMSQDFDGLIKGSVPLLLRTAVNTKDPKVKALIISGVGMAFGPSVIYHLEDFLEAEHLKTHKSDQAWINAQGIVTLAIIELAKNPETKYSTMEYMRKAILNAQGEFKVIIAIQLLNLNNYSNNTIEILIEAINAEKDPEIKQSLKDLMEANMDN